MIDRGKKNKPCKVAVTNVLKYGRCYCPNCGVSLNPKAVSSAINRRPTLQLYQYCSACGQLLDWSEVSDYGV